MKNIYKILLNYSVFVACILDHFVCPGVILVFYLIPMLIGLSIINYLNGEKWQSVLMLEIHLLIATVLGIACEAFLFLTFVVDDEMSVVIFEFAVLLGAILVFIMGIITTLIKFISIKRREKKES